MRLGSGTGPLLLSFHLKDKTVYSFFRFIFVFWKPLKQWIQYYEQTYQETNRKFMTSHDPLYLKLQMYWTFTKT